MTIIHDDHGTRSRQASEVADCDTHGSFKFIGGARIPQHLIKQGDQIPITALLAILSFSSRQTREATIYAE